MSSTQRLGQELTMPDNVAIAGNKEGWTSPILLLTWVARTVDAIGYLALGHVFTANMTSNALLLARAFGQGQFPAAFRALLAVGGCIFVVTISAVLTRRRGTDLDQRRAFVG